ncbi:hypothetical protein KKA00_03665 [bacterium]|nr:hypothetical protein [bacterium]MBU1651291.1 hypothetical protein [bacterium]MBU1881454.1 hypothetical protein [bacterium]
MSKRCFVVNEWLLNDLLGENGKYAGEESFWFLKKLKRKCDKIVVLTGSPWAEKAFR